MRRIFSILSLAVVAFGGVPADAAQRAWQADLSVRAFEVATDKAAGSISASVVIAADSDVARAVQVEIMLPVGVGVVSLPDECRASPGPVMSLSAHVTCTLGNIEAHTTREVSLTTTSRPRSPSRAPLRFAAFALSDTPDPLPANNFAERTLR